MAQTRYTVADRAALDQCVLDLETVAMFLAVFTPIEARARIFNTAKQIRGILSPPREEVSELTPTIADGRVISATATLAPQS